MSDAISSRMVRRLTRGPTACQRCRRRKQKCDLKLPNCTNCEEAKVPCLTYNVGKQAELTYFTVPRNYVSNLEAQVARLTQEVQELRAQATPPRLSVSAGSAQNETVASSSPEYQQWMSNSLGRVVSEPSNHPHFFGMSSGITLARLVLAALRIDDLPSSVSAEQQSSQQGITGTDSLEAQASLPPRHTAEHLVEVYFQYRTAHLPIIDRPQVEQAMERAYAMCESQQVSSSDFPKDLFTIYMVFAITLCDIQHPSGGRPPESEECFRSAITEMNKVLAYSNRGIDSLRALLLLAQYIALCPSKGSLWLLTGITMRLAIDLGLHWESDAAKLRMDPDVLNEHRRLWWACYSFDRLLCITLGRPFAMADQGVHVGFPEPKDVEPQESAKGPSFAAQATRAHNSLCQLAQLESEMKHVLYSHFCGSSIAYPRADYTTWIGDIELRLQAWYDTLQPVSGAHPLSIFANQCFWDALHNNALLLLYRPSPVAQETTIEALQISFNASCRLISCIKTLYRERKLDIMWKWVHHLFMAGLTMLYCIWHSSDLRESIEVNKSISMLQSCGSTLSALSERWEGASGCRDAFETLSSVTIDWLVTPKVTEAQNSRADFEKHLQSLHQQLPSSFSENFMDGDPFALLSSGSLTFGYGESLNTAAEWPLLPSFDFNDFNFDGMI